MEHTCVRYKRKQNKNDWGPADVGEQLYKEFHIKLQVPRRARKLQAFQAS